ncbi:MAG: NAD-dependent glycerol dehydrogenase [Saprospiraceae bacterium]|jgi:NAD(P)-dependent dehydrogenase (short-subunit alcohol dehydrogenase family)|nr:NAD-dependent glycerol dehydrogenase [Saprospiraceae bacterium]
MKLFSLKDKVALVTGANGLLGAMHCRVLKEAGARVVAADVQALPEEVSCADISLVMDVTNKESIEGGMQWVESQLGPVDVLINNAAVNDRFEEPSLALERSKFENYPVEMWQRALDVNVTGVFLCCQVFGSAMALRGSGSIVNIASTYGIVAPDQRLYRDPRGVQQFYKSIAYPATKAAVLGMTRFLAAYWGERGVRVNALSPGGVQNHQDEWFIQNYAERTCLRRMASPEDYNGAIVFLASDASAYMTGANLVVDGGWTIV